MTPVSPGDSQRLEEAWDAMIGDSATVTAGLVAERAGDPTLAETGRAGDQQVLMTADPCALDEMGHHRAVDAAGRAQVEIFDAGRLSQGSELEPSGQPLGIALGGFTVDQQSEAILEAEGFKGSI